MSANHSLQKLLDELGRLPGIGPKSAQRIAYYLLEADAEEARRLAEAILEVKQEVHFCSRCFNYATADECSICQDSMRDTTRICVVGEPRDVQAIERTGSYHGLYHVLGGVISPMDKIGPEQLHIRELLARLGHEDIHEVIIATNPNIEQLQIPEHVEVYEINGPYFFGIANKFEEVMAQMNDRPKVRIIRMRKVPFIDSTGMHNLTNLITMSKKENIKIILSGVNDYVRSVLAKNGFYELVGEENICPNINQAIERAKQA